MWPFRSKENKAPAMSFDDEWDLYEFRMAAATTTLQRVNVALDASVANFPRSSMRGIIRLLAKEIDQVRATVTTSAQQDPTPVGSHTVSTSSDRDGL